MSRPSGPILCLLCVIKRSPVVWSGRCRFVVRSAAGGRAGQEDSRHRRFAPTGVGPVTPSAGADHPAGPPLATPAARTRHPRPAIRQNARAIASADDYRRMAMALLFGAAFGAASAWRSAPENARPSPLIHPADGRWPVIAGSRRRPSGPTAPKSPPYQREAPIVSSGPGRPASRGLCSPPHSLVTCPGRLPGGRRRNSTERSFDYLKRRNNYSSCLSPGRRGIHGAGRPITGGSRSSYILVTCGVRTSQ